MQSMKILILIGDFWEPELSQSENMRNAAKEQL